MTKENKEAWAEECRQASLGNDRSARWIEEKVASRLPVEAPIFGTVSDRWSMESLLSNSHVRNAPHVPSAIEPFPSLRTRSEWARSLWIVECCFAGRIARDLEGAVERERLIDYALLRAKPQVCWRTAGAERNYRVC